MIKSAIKHSAIRSPFRNPFVPGDDGYREYLKRSVFELNGTQWGELSEPVVLDGDFEIEWVGSIASDPVTTGAYLLADSRASSSFRVAVYNNRIYVGSAVSDQRFVVTGVDFKKINRIIISRINGVVSAFLNGVGLDASMANPTPSTYTVDLISKQWGGTTSVENLVGSIFSTRIWTNGDRNTGDLILNVPFDESSSDYQRNHAVPLGAELVTNGDFSEGLGSWTPGATSELETGNNSIIVRSTAGGVSARYAQYLLTGLEIGKNYLASVRVKNTGGTNNDLITIKLNMRNSDSSGHRQAATGADSIGELLELVFTANSETMKLWLRFDGSQSDNTTFVEFSDPSIREWSGVILHSALPDDWMQIERKRWWDYWLGENIILTNIQEWSKAFNGTSSIIGEADGSVTILSPDNDYAAVYSMELTIGHKYLISGTYNAIEGYAAINIGPETETQFTEVGFNNYIFEGIAAGNSLTLKRYGGGGEDTVNFTTPNARRKLEIAS